MTALQRLPFWAALIVLAAAMAAGVYAFVRTHFVLWLLLAIVGVAIFGAVYLYEYSQLPGPPGWFAASSTPSAAHAPTDLSHPESRKADAEAGVPAEPAAQELPVLADPEDLDPDYDPVADADTMEQTRDPGADTSAPEEKSSASGGER